MSVRYENIDDPTAVYAVVHYGDNNLKVRIGHGRRGALKALMGALADNYVRGYYDDVEPQEVSRRDERVEENLVQAERDLVRLESALEDLLSDEDVNELEAQAAERQVSELKQEIIDLEIKVRAISRNHPSHRRRIQEILRHLAETQIDVDDTIPEELQEGIDAVIPTGVSPTYGNFTWFWLASRTGEFGAEEEDVDIVLAEQFG